MKRNLLCLLSMLAVSIAIKDTTTIEITTEYATYETTDSSDDDYPGSTIDPYYDPPSLFSLQQAPPPLLFSAPRCPFPDPLTHTVMLPYPGNCSRFYMCSNGNPILFNCSRGLHFNPSLSVCDWPWNANCREGCLPLKDDFAGVWSPPSCSAGTNTLGASCSLQCRNGYVLRGSAYIQCTPDGWNSANGKHIPECVPKECIGEDLENQLNNTLSVPASLLFVLDESGSVGSNNFLITKNFVRDVIVKFPLSSIRSAGVITFSHRSLVPIPLNERDTSSFLKNLDAIQYYGGGTDILDALNTTYYEILSRQVHPLTLVFLITDGESQTDGTPAANRIKAANHPLFTVGIGRRLVHLESLSSQGANGIKHFFHLQDYGLLQSIGQYLNPPSGSSGSSSNQACKRP